MSFGKSVERGLGGEADQLGPADRRVAGDGLDDGAQRRGPVVFDVGGDLGQTGGGQPQPDGAELGQTLVAALSDVGRDLFGVLERRGRLELDVEGDQRRPGGDENGARRWDAGGAGRSRA